MPSDRPADELPRRHSRYSRLRRRLHAWWEGIDLPPDADNDQPGRLGEPLLLDTKAPSERDFPESAAERAKLWPIRRIEAAELIWGEDALLPGGADYSVTLAKPLGLTAALSLLDLTGGLGGSTRALAQAFGVWVTGLERDGDLAREAHARSTQAKLEKKAPVREFDPDNLELKRQAFDCIFARELFYTIADKKRLLMALQSGLKDRGQLLFTDYVLGPQPQGASFRKWADGERLPCYPVALELLQSLLESLHFDCRIAADDSDTYRTYVMAAWTRIAEELESGRIPRHLLSRVVEEAERWARFVDVLNEGEMRVYRFHAFYKQG